MKNILVPVDFSPASMRAIHYAAALARVIKGEVKLLYVDEQVKKLTASVLVAVQYKTSYAEKRLDKLARLVKKEYKIKCSYQIEKGDVAKRICSTAKEMESQFIVMGTRGNSSIKQRLAGTQTIKVVRRAFCPVLVIPAGSRYKGWKKMVYATDYHSNDEECIKTFVNIARKFDGHLNVLHVCNIEDREPEKMILDNFSVVVRRRTRYRKISFRLLVGKPEAALNTYARNESVDLMIFSANNKNWIEKMIGSRITRRMVFHTKVPFMAWKA